MLSTNGSKTTLIEKMPSVEKKLMAKAEGDEKNGFSREIVDSRKFQRLCGTGYEEPIVFFQLKKWLDGQETTNNPLLVITHCWKKTSLP